MSGIGIALYSLAMRIAIPVWNSRVSPVMDTARRIMVVDLESNKSGQRQMIDLGGANPHELIKTLEMMEIDILICGAISAQLETQLQSINIRIYPWIRGKVDLILSAFTQGALDREELRLPGCHGRGRGHGFKRRHGLRRNIGKFKDER